jgi:hypothetical protein
MTIAETIYQHVKTMPLAKAIEVLHFVEFLETKPDVIAKDTPQTEDDFFNAAGLWKDRDISQESIRAEAWRDNEQ